MLQVQSIFVPWIYQTVTRLKAEKNLTNGQWPIYSANMFVVRDTKARGMKNALKNYCSEFRMPSTARKTKWIFLLYLIASIVFEVHQESKEV